MFISEVELAQCESKVVEHKDRLGLVHRETYWRKETMA